MNGPITPFFYATVSSPDMLTRDIAADFLGTQAIALLKGAPYLKEKKVADLKQAWRVCVKNTQGKTAGQCLLTDVGNEQADYTAPYPVLGKTLILTSLCMHAGHNSVKGTIPPGMGPTSTLFREVVNFALQNGFQTIVAKTNARNSEGRDVFEEKDFTPSSPIIVDNEGYESIFYVKELSPVAM